jgi:hypothetical protein
MMALSKAICKACVNKHRMSFKYPSSHAGWEFEDDIRFSQGIVMCDDDPSWYRDVRCQPNSACLYQTEHMVSWEP